MPKCFSFTSRANKAGLLWATFWLPPQACLCMYTAGCLCPPGGSWQDPSKPSARPSTPFSLPGPHLGRAHVVISGQKGTPWGFSTSCSYSCGNREGQGLARGAPTLHTHHTRAHTQCTRTHIRMHRPAHGWAASNCPFDLTFRVWNDQKVSLCPFPPVCSWLSPCPAVSRSTAGTAAT